MRRSELKRGTTPLRTKKPMATGSTKLRRVKQKAEKPKRAAREEAGRDLMDLCRGQECYLRVPGVYRHDPETVVACHSNQLAAGKGTGLKAHNKFTVPGCHACHAELDQGQQFTKAEKFAIWDQAFMRWEPVRAKLRKNVSNP